ncbi:hypothetical protein [Agrobacterium phage Atu_ph04]|uniref:Thymidylate synthase n=1 Tax=Agrobacterium phage Atu_ph04 TaxID=2024263 RepID=A0A2L0UZ74_9CAUD|nr:thymidylate synthase [Agrobacterium phage Atu_ph04]AUZ94810.1 hypothetical protein [Agrobacterium phage Atu_ph04]
MTEISAKIICASMGEHAPPIYTAELVYPLPIHAEFMTHRAFSKNSASLRAIPTKSVIKQLQDNPFVPIHMGKNQSGMQADETNDQLVKVLRKDFLGRLFRLKEEVTVQEAWLRARDAAIEIAEAISDANYHKQVVNRILAPFLHNRVLSTGVSFDNFMGLRDHKDAEPHIRELAARLKEAIEYAPVDYLHANQYHLPYITQHEKETLSIEHQIKISVARNARVSYNLTDGSKSTVQKDLELFERLAGSVPVHASPTEHIAMPDFIKSFNSKTGKITWMNPERHRNLTGWQQYRSFIPNDTFQDTWKNILVDNLRNGTVKPIGLTKAS